ncbi:MAG: hypothetical protein JNK67_12770 [Alphaproteobacteria bacterium]|nr:hypothetical protein [Alphaproteobacteria bacterium]
MHDQAAATTTDTISGCPFHAAAAAADMVATTRDPDEIDAGDELVLPANRQTIVQYAKDASGVTELRLYYGDKEISFDEPELFAFGETLAKQSRFVARDAASWGPGYEWPRIRTLLRQLVEAEVLVRADAPAALLKVHASGDRPSPLPPAPCATPRSWFECEAITAELTGRPVELGHLEMVIPIFRVAHIAIDGDGRQIGEANVFPRALRVEVPTSWRTCNLPGSRYQGELPMNVTALKAMRQQWPQMMGALLRVREAYLKRFPQAAAGWTVGHIERLATMVLAVPTYQLMRQDGPVANGDLHPALSSMFRVTDGLRMTMHQMLFVPIGEPTKSPHEPMDVDAILDYAERNFSFHSDHGVCAGPQAMVREFLQVLIDGRAATDFSKVALEAPVESALADMDAALDYGLAGLQVYAAVFSLWPVMTRAYEQIAEIVETMSDGASEAVVALRSRMREHLDRMRKGTFLGTERWRADREQVYVDMYEQCGRALTGARGGPRFVERIAPRHGSADVAAELKLHGLLERRLAPIAAADAATLRALSAAIMDFLRREQAILRTASAAQAELNRVLGRPQPARPFGSAEVDVHNLLQGAESRRLPYLIDELEQLLGVGITVHPDTIDITERAGGAAA